MIIAVCQRTQNMRLSYELGMRGKRDSGVGCSSKLSSLARQLGGGCHHGREVFPMPRLTVWILI
jgi:hypothetical protein